MPRPRRMDLGDVVPGQLSRRAGVARGLVGDELGLEHPARGPAVAGLDPGGRGARLAPAPRLAAMAVVTDRRVIAQALELLARPEERRNRVGQRVVGPSRQLAERHLGQRQRVVRRARTLDGGRLVGARRCRRQRAVTARPGVLDRDRSGICRRPARPGIGDHPVRNRRRQRTDRRLGPPASRAAGGERQGAHSDHPRWDLLHVGPSDNAPPRLHIRNNLSVRRTSSRFEPRARSSPSQSEPTQADHGAYPSRQRRARATSTATGTEPQAHVAHRSHSIF